MQFPGEKEENGSSKYKQVASDKHLKCQQSQKTKKKVNMQKKETR